MVKKTTERNLPLPPKFSFRTPPPSLVGLPVGNWSRGRASKDRIGRVFGNSYICTRDLLTKKTSNATHLPCPLLVTSNYQLSPTANHQLPTAANRQPLLSIVSVVFCLADVLTRKQRASL